MSAEVICKKNLSPSSSLDPDKQDRPASLPFSPGNSPCHYHHRSRCGNSSSSDGGVGESERGCGCNESEGVESTHLSSSGISSGSAPSPGGEEGEGEKEKVGETERSYQARKNFQRGGVVSLPLPPPKNGVFKMSSKAKLQNLLAKIAKRDEFYTGLEESSDDPSNVPGGYSSLGEGPSSFAPLEGIPTSQPPSLIGLKSASVDSPFFHMSSLTFKDGITPTGIPEAFPRKRGGVWTLNLVDGNLFLFKTNPKTEEEEEEEEEEEGKEEEMEGIELAKLLRKSGTPESPANYYYNLPARILDAEIDNPHVSPVYTPATGPKYRLYRRHDPEKMTPTEYILHHNKVLLVLEDEDDTPIINAVTHDDIIAMLEKLSEEGKSFPDASFNPVVNIKVDSGHARSASEPNNIAIYFTGKHNQFRYYVTVDDQGRLVPLKKALPLPTDDWKNHLEFSNNYFTPPTLVAMATGGGGGSEGLPSISESETEN